MNGNFVYCNPTKLYFGEDSLDFLNEELPKYGKNVVLVYGAGSIKENGIYDKVINILKKNEKNIAEIAGVMPNPTLAKLYEGIKIARNHNADLQLPRPPLTAWSGKTAIPARALVPRWARVLREPLL